MNITKLCEAIRSRATSDTTSGGLFYTSSPLITGFYKDIAPAGLASSYPYCVFNLANIANFDAFSIANREVILRIALYTSNSTTGATRSAIIDRLLGNWLTTGTRVPSYGFDRHAMTITGGWGASAMVYQGYQEQSDGNIMQTVLEFRFYTYKTAT